MNTDKVALSGDAMSDTVDTKNSVVVDEAPKPFGRSLKAVNRKKQPPFHNKKRIKKKSRMKNKTLNDSQPQKENGTRKCVPVDYMASCSEMYSVMIASRSELARNATLKEESQFSVQNENGASFVPFACVVGATTSERPFTPTLWQRDLIESYWNDKADREIPISEVKEFVEEMRGCTLNGAAETAVELWNWMYSNLRQHEKGRQDEKNPCPTPCACNARTVGAEQSVTLGPIECNEHQNAAAVIVQEPSTPGPVRGEQSYTGSMLATADKKAANDSAVLNDAHSPVSVIACQDDESCKPDRTAATAAMLQDDVLVPMCDGTKLPGVVDRAGSSKKDVGTTDSKNTPSIKDAVRTANTTESAFSVAKVGPSSTSTPSEPSNAIHFVFKAGQSATELNVGEPGKTIPFACQTEESISLEATGSPLGEANKTMIPLIPRIEQSTISDVATVCEPSKTIPYVPKVDDSFISHATTIATMVDHEERYLPVFSNASSKVETLDTETPIAVTRKVPESCTQVSKLDESGDAASTKSVTEDVNSCVTNTTSVKNQALKIAALERTVKAQDITIAEQKQQKLRMVSKMKQKKGLIVQLEAKLSATEKSLSNVTAEMIQLGVVTQMRDTYKNKARGQQEEIKESRNLIQSLEKKLRYIEKSRALENELLENFQKLAIHTGYYKWGKPIRLVEAKLALHKESQEAEDHK